MEQSVTRSDNLLPIGPSGRKTKISPMLYAHSARYINRNAGNSFSTYYTVSHNHPTIAEYMNNKRTERTLLLAVMAYHYRSSNGQDRNMGLPAHL